MGNVYACCRHRGGERRPLRGSNGGQERALKRCSLSSTTYPAALHQASGAGGLKFEPSLHELCDLGPEDDPGSIRSLLEGLGVEVEWVPVPDAYRVITTAARPGQSGCHDAVWCGCVSGKDGEVCAGQPAVDGEVHHALPEHHGCRWPISENRAEKPIRM